MRPIALRAAGALLVAGLLAACGAPAAPPDPVLSGEQDAARRVAAILDYVAADYPKALGPAGILDATEYAEQGALLRDALELARELPVTVGWLPEELERISGLVADTTPGAEVASAARTARRRLLEAYGVRLVPSRPPSRTLAARLYQRGCASCHGVDGRGDGPAAAGLVPPPLNFRDPAAAADLSPARVFNALTDGVPGTGMPPFGSLTSHERWSLAFYVLALRHGGDAGPEGGVEVALPPGIPGPDTLEVLAGDTDRALLERLAAAGLTGAEGRRALATLRRAVPFREDGGADLGPTLLALEEAVRRYEAGDAAGARAQLTAAYLDGIEPLEPTLRSRDPGLVREIEKGFMTLRERSREGAPVSTFAEEAEALRDRVARAESLLTGEERRLTPFLSAAVILLREGLEAVLLVSLLLGLVRRAGERRDERAAHLGWITAVLLGVATWFGSAWVIRMGGARREIMEGGVTLLAAAVLVYVGHFALARASADRRVRSLRERLAATSPSSRFAVLFGLTFAAVYREAFEVVLFLQAVRIQSPGAGWAVAAGAAAGILACAALAGIVVRAGSRLRPGVILEGTGILLCLLAVVFVGKGLHALQEAGVLGLRYVPAPRIEWLGLYPTVQTLGAQAVVLLAVLTLTRLGNRRATARLPAR